MNREEFKESINQFLFSSKEIIKATMFSFFSLYLIYFLNLSIEKNITIITTIYICFSFIFIYKIYLKISNTKFFFIKNYLKSFFNIYYYILFLVLGFSIINFFDFYTINKVDSLSKYKALKSIYSNSDDLLVSLKILITLSYAISLFDINNSIVKLKFKVTNIFNPIGFTILLLIMKIYSNSLIYSFELTNIEKLYLATIPLLIIYNANKNILDILSKIYFFGFEDEEISGNCYTNKNKRLY